VTLRTRKEQEATIAALAAEAFTGHVLTPYLSYERCGRPGDSMYAFCVYVAPYAIAIWGDLGEFMLRIGDADALKWLLTAGSRDYVLGKVMASREARREFMIGDAHATLALRHQEAVADGDERAVAKVQKIRTRFAERLDDMEPDAHAWAGAWYDAGDSDPPPCDSWSSDLLWLWEAILCYRRLRALSGSSDQPKEAA
jgi:hypothetical protein